MNKFTKDELKAKAAGVFKANPEAEEVYMNTDGQPFLHDVHAKSWAAENRTEVVSFTKAQLEKKEAPKPKGKGKGKEETKPEQPAEQEMNEENPKGGSEEDQPKGEDKDPKEEDKN